MRIDFLVLDPTARGGIARSTFTTAAALVGLGHDVRVVGLIPGNPRPALPWPDRVGRATLVARRPLLFRAGWAPSNVVAFLRTLRGRRRASAVVGGHDALAHRYSQATDRALARYLLATNADVVLGTRPGINLALACLPRRRGLKVVAVEHVGLHQANEATRAAYRQHFSSLDAVVTLTRIDLRRYRGLVGEDIKLRAIPNAINEGSIQSSEPETPREPIIAAGGRLVPQKGFDLLLEAWAQVAPRYPSWRLEISGDGPLRAELAARAGDPDLAGRVRLMGFRPDLPRELHRPGVFVLSSRFEGMPMVLLEAMAAGCAVVAFDCPTGPRQLIRHERDGLLVPPGSVDDLAAAMDVVLADEALRRALGRRARQRAESFNLTVVARRWERLLSSLADRTTHAPPPQSAPRGAVKRSGVNPREGRAGPGKPDSSRRNANRGYRKTIGLWHAMLCCGT